MVYQSPARLYQCMANIGKECYIIAGERDMATTQRVLIATEALDSPILEVCEERKLSSRRYKLADQRSGAVNQMLEREGSPSRSFHARIFLQASMALETNCKLAEGPHDLDFALQLNAPYWQGPAMAALNALYQFLSSNEARGRMIPPKNRVVRRTTVCGYFPSRDAFSHTAGKIWRSA